MNEIGKKIRMLRRKEDKSQEQIAKQLGISIPAFSKMETGVTDMNVSRIHQIANLFKVKPVFFFEEAADEEMIDSEKNELRELIQQKTTTILELQSRLIRSYEEIEQMKKNIKNSL